MRDAEDPRSAAHVLLSELCDILHRISMVVIRCKMVVTPLNASRQVLLLVNLGKRRRLLAQCVKFKEGSRKVASVGQKISIPADYDGYFEILSEDGRSVRCIESVAELCKRFPDSVLVRESVRAFVSRGDDVDALTEGGEGAKSTRTIAEGETLILVGEAVGGGGRNR